MRELKVDAIKDGTVIDHIPAGSALKLIEILKLGNEAQILIGTQLSSKKYGRKDVIKIENREFTEDELNMITLLAPTATFVIIRNFETIRKADARIPREINGLMSCPNPTCITNTESMMTHFSVEAEQPVSVRCRYCERVYHIDDINKFIYPQKEE